MFAYELHQIRSAELIRRAEEHRMVREALRSRRASRRAEAEAPQDQAHTSPSRRHRVARAAS